MTQTKANYLAEWLREEAERTHNLAHSLMIESAWMREDVWNFIALNLPEAEEAYESVMEDERTEEKIEND